jgi:hypothetical protein
MATPAPVPEPAPWNFSKLKEAADCWMVFNSRLLKKHSVTLNLCELNNTKQNHGYISIYLMYIDVGHLTTLMCFTWISNTQYVEWQLNPHNCCEINTHTHTHTHTQKKKTLTGTRISNYRVSSLRCFR